MRPKSRVANSMLNIITGLGGQLLVTALKFVTRTVFIATLGKSYLGINSLFSNILAMLSLTELGLDTAINFKLYKPLAENDNHQICVLMKFYKQAYRVIGCVIFGTGILLIPALRFLIKDYNSLRVLGINATLIFILYLLKSVLSYLFFAYQSAIIKAAQKTYVLNIAEYAVVILSNTAQILVLIFLKDFVFYTSTLIFFSVFQNGVNAVIAKKMFPKAFVKEKDKLSRNEIKSLFKDCGALFVYKINGVVLHATDNLVLSAFAGLVIVGLYSNYLIFYSAITLLLGRVYASIQASMGNLFATEDVSRSYFHFELMNFLTIIFYGTSCICIAIISNEFIGCWLGVNYQIPQPFSILLGIEILLWGLKTNLGQIRNITGAFRQMWFRPALGIIINLVVSIGTVQFLGIYGVLLGTIIADFTTNFMIDPFIIHKYSFNEYKPTSYYYRKNIKYIIILALVGTVDMLLCNVVLPEMSWLSVTVHILICGCSVPFVFYLFYRKTEICQYLMMKLHSAVIGKRK